MVPSFGNDTDPGHAAPDLSSHSGIYYSTPHGYIYIYIFLTIVVLKVTVGVVNLIPSEKYLPLRLHVIRGLIELSIDTETFIPIMPMLISTIKLIPWQKKPKVVSMKPLNLSCALRVSDKQTKESAFRDAAIEGFQDMALGYLTGL